MCLVRVPFGTSGFFVFGWSASRAPNGLEAIALRHFSGQRLKAPLQHLQVVHDRCSPESEKVLPHAPVASSPPLAACRVSEAVLDARALTQLFAPGRCFLELAHPVLQRFVLGDRYRSTFARAHFGTLRAGPSSVARP